jgi:predicted HicB family RNase H-like nuclease
MSMITVEKQTEVKRTVERIYANCPDWVTFYRETLGLRGVIRHTFPTREALSAFEQTEAYQEILRMLTKLREQGPMAVEEDEPTRVITIRLPKSMHETLRTEAHEHKTSMNKLCISKLLQFIDNENVPTEIY